MRSRHSRQVELALCPVRRQRLGVWYRARPDRTGIERPVAHRLGDMRPRDRLGVIEIGNCSRDFEHPMIRTRGQSASLSGGREEIAGVAVHRRPRIEPSPGCVRVALRARHAVIPGALPSSGPLDADANRGGWLTPFMAAEIADRNSGQADLHVDAIGERS